MMFQNYAFLCGQRPYIIVPHMDILSHLYNMPVEPLSVRFRVWDRGAYIKYARKHRGVSKMRLHIP